MTSYYPMVLVSHSCSFHTHSVQFSLSVVSDSLWPHELQHARPPCPSPTPGVHSNSCPSSRWCHPAISPSVICFSSCPQSLPASEFFSNESTLHVRWPKYWSFSFSISPFNLYSLLSSKYVFPNTNAFLLFLFSTFVTYTTLSCLSFFFPSYFFIIFSFMIFLNY